MMKPPDMKLLADLSWEETQAYLSHDDRIVLPLGAVEEHGRHLGLGTDFVEAEAIALAIGERSEVLVAPTLNYGVSLAQMGFAGTLSLKPVTLIMVLEDLFRSFYHHGFRRVLVVNGHGGNAASIWGAVQTVSQDLRDLRVKVFQWWTDAEAYQVITDALGKQEGSHASGGETAFMLALRPQAVRMERLTGRDVPVVPSREVITVQTFEQQYPDGIMGLDPRNATPEVGRALLEKCAEICCRELSVWPAPQAGKS
jgi:creatinine amidohydrolase